MQLGLVGLGRMGGNMRERTREAGHEVVGYDRNPDIAKMFATPRYVLKGGTLLVEEGQLRRAPAGRRLRLRPGYDEAMLPDLRRYFEAYSTVAFENYPVTGIADDPLPLRQ